MSERRYNTGSSARNVRDSAEIIRCMPAAARALLGEPQSDRKDGEGERVWRWNGRGSFMVRPDKGTWQDHEGGDGKAHGVLALLKRQLGIEGADAIRWLEENAGLPKQEKKGNPVVATYDYRDAARVLMGQVCRKANPKTFVQRRPDPDKPGKWIWKGFAPIPYRLPELIEALADEKLTFIVEGEKDVDRLWSIGIAATCNPGGANKWTAALNPHLRGAHVVVIPDNDPQARDPNGKLRFHPDGRPVFPGQDHAAGVAKQLANIAASVRVLELPELPEKGDVSDWLNAGGTADQLLHLVETQALTWPFALVNGRFVHANGHEKPHGEDVRAQQERAEQFAREQAEKRRFKAFIYPEDVKIEPLEWILPGIIPAGPALGDLFGPSGVGKSTLAIALASSVCRGTLFFGRQCIKGSVFYIAAEDGRGVMRRAAAWRKVSNIKGGVPLAILDDTPDLYTANENDVDALIEHMKAEARRLQDRGEPAPVLVCFDTERKIAPGMKENSSEDRDTLCRNLRRILAELKITGLMLSHVSLLGDGNDPRGSTALIGDVDFAIGLRKTEKGDANEAWVRKTRDGPSADSDTSLRWGYTIESADMGVTGQDGKPETVALFKLANEPPPPLRSRGKKAPKQPEGVPVMRRAIHDLLQKGEIRADCDGKKAVRWDDVRERTKARGLFDPDAKPNTNSQKLSRAKTWLLDHGGLEERNGWVFWFKTA